MASGLRMLGEEGGFRIGSFSFSISWCFVGSMSGSKVSWTVILAVN